MRFKVAGTGWSCSERRGRAEKVVGVSFARLSAVRVRPWQRNATLPFSTLATPTPSKATAALSTSCAKAAINILYISMRKIDICFEFVANYVCFLILQKYEKKMNKKILVSIKY